MQKWHWPRMGTVLMVFRKQSTKAGLDEGFQMGLPGNKM